MAATFVILGAGSDVTSRYVVPGLVQLHLAQRLPPDLRIVASGRHDRSDEEYRDDLRAVACEEGCDEAAVDEVIGRIEWVEADATEADHLDDLPVADEGDVVVYLALPPSTFADAIAAIAACGWAARARLAIEKPFGTDRASAESLNELLGAHFDPARVFRVDHFLGLAATRSLSRSDATDPTISIDSTARRIDLVWDETLALEGRAGYYDDTGALVDMLQNHLLQVLAVALAGPVPDGALPDERLEVMRSLQAAPETSVRARYVSGTVDGQPVPSYVDEEVVEPSRQTETFAQVDLASDDPRWEGVALRLRSGKALARDRHHLRVRDSAGEERVVDLSDPGDDGRLGPYARVLGDLLDGDQTWFVSAAEAEEQWRIVEPVLGSWRAGVPPLGEYRAGSEEVR